MPCKITIIEVAAASFENNTRVNLSSGDKFTEVIIEFNGLLEKDIKYFS